MSDDLLILASGSPRRRELLQRLVPRFEVLPCSLREPRDRPPHVPPADWAEALAYFKARAVAERHPGRWVLGADTIVFCAGRLLGQPRDLEDARRMLWWQADRVSEVITGVCLLKLDPGLQRRFFSECTRVWMRGDRDGIEAYLRSGDWQGKAGAYGIQNVGDRLVARWEGSFDNVVGLPTERLARLLAEVGLFSGDA